MQVDGRLDLRYIEEVLKDIVAQQSEIAEQLRVLNTHLEVLDTIQIPPFLRKGKRPLT